MDQDQDQNARETISPTFRNGSVTVVGVLAAFSLTYVTAWAANPIPWGLDHLFGFVPLVIGIVFQLWALAALLDPNRLEATTYRQDVRVFLIGMTLVAVGVVLTLVVDVVALATKAG